MRSIIKQNKGTGINSAWRLEELIPKELVPFDLEIRLLQHWTIAYNIINRHSRLPSLVLVWLPEIRTPRRLLLHRIKTPRWLQLHRIRTPGWLLLHGRWWIVLSKVVCFQNWMWVPHASWLSPSIPRALCLIFFYLSTWPVACYIFLGESEADRGELHLILFDGAVLRHWAFG